MKSILFVTCEEDVHANMVELLLQQRGYAPIRLHLADIPMQVLVQTRIEETQWSGILSTNQTTIDLAEIGAIWWRKPNSYQLSKDLPKDEQDYARREAQHTMSGIWSNLGCYWMSFPSRIARASNKVEQLRRAAQMGFHIPKTLISNNPEEVRAFYDELNGHIIYKSLEYPALFGPSVEASDSQVLTPVREVYTSSLTKEHIDHLDAVKYAPCCF